MGPKSIIGLAGTLIILLLVSSSVYIIPETHRGVLLRFGELIDRFPTPVGQPQPE